MRTYRMPINVHFNRLWLRPLFRGIFRLLAQVRIEGKEHIPRAGNYLVAINHVSIFDPPFIIAFWTEPLEAIGAVEIWRKPGQAILARLYGGIQVHRGQYDRALLETALQALNSGQRLLIAPEGGRSHQPGLRRGLPGIAYLADKSKLPVIPVGIVGTTEDFFSNAMQAILRRKRRPILEMHIGEPINLPPVHEKGAERRLALQRNTDLVMKKIAELLPPEYRGVYAS